MKLITNTLAVIALAASTLLWAAIDINTADVKTLDKLSGVGPAKAQAIVDYRAKNGPFQTIDDLKKVDGIGDKTFEDIKGAVTVGGSAAKK